MYLRVSCCAKDQVTPDSIPFILSKKNFSFTSFSIIAFTSLSAAPCAPRINNLMFLLSVLFDNSSSFPDTLLIILPKLTDCL